MAELPATGFVVFNLVHKLTGGSGGPTRVIAVVGKGATDASSTAPTIFSTYIVAIMFAVIAMMWIFHC